MDFMKIANLQGPPNGSHRKRQCLDDADVVIGGAQHFSKSIGHHGWPIGRGSQWLLLGNHRQHLGTCPYPWLSYNNGRRRLGDPTSLFELQESDFICMISFAYTLKCKEMGQVGYKIVYRLTKTRKKAGGP
uniref:Uncharacterized protein n=1 Tax=Romanomermis culicivorax TaxID=13658 RepID=A0A915L586_ROMCU